MKYVIRRGVFETNSSSTHSMTLLLKGEKKEKEDDLGITESEDRTVSTKLMKAVILFEFYCYHVGSGILLSEGEYEEVKGSFSKKEKETYEATLKLIEDYKNNLLNHFDKAEDKEYINLMHKSILKDFNGYRPACNTCFQNDVLADCTCGLSYENIAKKIGISLKDNDADNKILEAILTDKYYFHLHEEYYGGMWDDDFPTDF